MAPNAGSNSGWGDGDIMQDVLSTAKGQTKFYATAATESANPGVRETFLAFHGEAQHDLEVTFSFLHTRGLYPTPSADPGQLQQTIQRFQQTHSQLGEPNEPSMRRYKTADPALPPKADTEPKTFDYKSDTMH